MYRLKIIYLKENMKFKEEFEKETKKELLSIIQEYQKKYRLIYLKWERINV